MVSAQLSDALSNPTESLRDFYKTCGGDSANFADQVASHYKNVFASSDALRQIPTLNTYRPPPSHKQRTLVRFRAMVQDTSPSPEIYLAKMKDGGLGGWGISDLSDLDEDGTSFDYSDLRERTVAWATSIPGEAPWVAEYLDDPDELNVPSSVQAQSSSPHKFPCPGAAHVGLCIKMYTAQTLRPTELLTCVGILDTEDLLPNDAPTAVPHSTLHILFTLPLPSTLVDSPYPYRLPEDTTASLSELRQELLSWIADESLGGDRGAAEWVLLVCIAKVISRSPSLFPPSVTLAKFPRPLPGSAVSEPTLSHVIAALLPVLVSIPLSLELLNGTSFAPHSEDEDLHSGWLQLPAASVVVNETLMGEGKVTERGLRNIRSLQEVMTSQKISYAFPFSSFSFPTDINFIVLVEGKKSLCLTTDVICTIKPIHVGANMYKDKTSIAFPPAEKMAAFRRLVNGSRAGRVEIDDTLAQHIESEFVKQRQQSAAQSESTGAAVTPDDLIRRMTLAKLMSLSLHEIELTKATWEHVYRIDQERLEQLNEVTVPEAPGRLHG